MLYIDVNVVLLALIGLTSVTLNLKISPHLPLVPHLALKRLVGNTEFLIK